MFGTVNVVVLAGTFAADPVETGRRIVELLGDPAAVELLAVFELSEPDRAALIGAL